MVHSDALRNLLDGIDKYRDRLVCAVVHLNDTYLIDERTGKLPGFPRLIATLQLLRDRIQRVTSENRLVVVHSGDFLGPSRIGKKDKGAAMVELLNRCGLSYCVIGNHEFDYKADALIARLARASFDVVSCNVKLPSSIKSQEIALWPTPSAPRVAFTGVVSSTVHRSFEAGWSFSAETQALQQFARKTQGIPFHVVLSHATRDEDRAMRKALADSTRTVVLGGHDHHIDWAETDGPPVLYKNRANLETVRVLLLLAGGDTALNQLNGRYGELKHEAGSPPRFDARTVDALLEPLHACDAAVFRDWILQDIHLAERGAAPLEYFDDDDELPRDALAHRLAGLPVLEDVWSHVLAYPDFLPANATDAAYVQSVLQSIRVPGEAAIVHDFSTSTTRLDARDDGLRSGPTDFGLWVAECVRLEAGADIAILNAGAFRSDTELAPVVTQRDLLDTFLYDEAGPGGERPVIVLQMPNADIETLLEHGRGRLDAGSYPQVSDRRAPGTSSHVIAISSYVLLHEKSIDGYIEALAQRLGRTVPELRAQLRAAVQRSFSIVPAIVQHGPGVGYAAPPAAILKQNDVTTFTVLAKSVSLAFDRTVTNPALGPAEWNAAFHRVFSDPTAASTPELREARDALRSFLLRIRHGDMRRFVEDLAEHQANFADRVSYVAIFKAAVHGIPGLQTYGSPY